MIKKSIKYVDFNGNEREEDFYFHMSVPEVTRLQTKVAPESIEDYILRIAREDKLEAVLELIEEIILGSVGTKSPNGKSFIKNKEFREEFEYSQAYAELFEELMTKPDSLQAFAAGIGALVKPAPSDTAFTVAQNGQ